MKSYILYVILYATLAGMISACSPTDAISISGEINNPGNAKVVSFYEGERKLDSVFLGDNGRFKFERATTQSRLLSLRVGNNRYPIILEPGKKVQFTADMHSEDADYQIEGSDLSQKLKEFAPLQSRKDFVQDSLQSEFVKAAVGKEAQAIESLRSEYLLKFKEQLGYYTQQAVQFADNNPNLAGFYVMSTLDPEMAEVEIIEYADRIQDKFLDNRYVGQFKEEALKLKKLATGQPAPQIEAYTPDNKVVRLSDYKGKLTLVDFWASWCAPCRQENPNIVEQYNLFKNKGFEVLGVSLDDNPGSWIRAIEEDDLIWTNVSDLQAWSSDLIIEYRIKAIPTSYIVDEEGLIVAKNLRGAELGKFLQDWFH